MAALKWDDVVQTPEYQSLNPAQRLEAQKQYFSDAIAPQLPKDADINRIRLQFLTDVSENKQNTDPTVGMSADQKFVAGAGKAFVDLARGAGQLTGLVDRKSIDEAKSLDAPLMQSTDNVLGMNVRPAFWGNLTGNITAALPASVIPGANTALGAAAIGAGLGALQPVGTNDSRLTNTTVGAALGLGGYGLGKLADRAVTSAREGVANIENSIASKANAQAAAETASARSAAGNAAQNAYRQLEHLRELGALRTLTPEEAQVAAQLEQELAGKAAEKLLPAAAAKEATAKAYQEALSTEGQRAADLAASKLSGSEAMNQLMVRLKRYGPAAVGGAIGHFLIPGLGTAGGAATGLVLRPAIRSAMNLAKNPAVQRGLLMPIADAGLLTNPAIPQALGLLGPSSYFANE